MGNFIPFDHKHFPFYEFLMNCQVTRHHHLSYTHAHTHTRTHVHTKGKLKKATVHRTFVLIPMISWR